MLIEANRLSQPNLFNCADLDGRHSTPLHFASGYNRIEIVKYLLENGADVHAKDKGYVVIIHQIEFMFHSSFLHISCVYENSHV